jgi:hypothetical protein
MSDEEMMFGELTKVGFWKQNGKARVETSYGRGLGGRLLDIVVGVAVAAIEAELPNVFDHVDTEWDKSQRDRVIRYVSDEKFRGESYLGDSICRFCGKHNGSADFSDGRHIWPEGLAHYLREHGVRPLPSFVRYALRRSR